MTIISLRVFLSKKTLVNFVKKIVKFKYRKVASICVYNMEINFFPKGHSKQTSNFPFIDNLKKPACAFKQDKLELPTLR